MASGGDEGGIFWGEGTQEGGAGGPSSNSVNRVKYREFIRTFRLDEEYVYREALRSAIVTRQHMMEVDIDHLMEFDEELTNDMLSKPSIHLPIFEKGALEAAVTTSIIEEGQEGVHLQITLISSKQPISIRKLLSNQVSNLVTIPGIVISTSRVKAKATTVFAQCKSCQQVKQVPARARARARVRVRATATAKATATATARARIRARARDRVRVSGTDGLCTMM